MSTITRLQSRNETSHADHAPRRTRLGLAGALILAGALLPIACAAPSSEHDEQLADDRTEATGAAAEALTGLPTWEVVGPPETSSPAAASWGPGRLDVFVRGSNNKLVHSGYDGTWGPWESLGGILGSGPAVAAWGPGRLDVFAQGTDGTLQHVYFDSNQGGWSAWESLGGQIVGAPAVASWGVGRLDIFARGTDNTLRHIYYDMSSIGWSSWESLGGSLGSAPAVASWGSGRLDVFARGFDDTLQHRGFGGTWGPWESLGGRIGSAPAVASSGSAHLDVFARGFDNTVQHRGYSGYWGPWESLGGMLTRDPAASSWGSGRLDVFGVSATDGNILHTWYDHGAWHYVDLDLPLVQKFAPRLRFDGAASNYPMSAEEYYEETVLTSSSGTVDNTDYSTISNNEVPTYYQVIRCGNQVRIKYWFFYGYQSACDAFGDGTHNADWEDVMVTLSEDQTRAAAVTYWAHGKHYTRLLARDGFDIESTTHPVVYVGKTTHASYYNEGGSGTCLFWEDWRNNDSGSHMDTWQNLVNLAVDSEPWMAPDRTGSFSWGDISTHPTQSAPSCSVDACAWEAFEEAQWGTQCKKGDDDTGSECLQQCRPGYTDMGLTCTNWSTFDTYSKHHYGYDYNIPTSDLGLLQNDY